VDSNDNGKADSLAAASATGDTWRLDSKWRVSGQLGMCASFHSGRRIVSNSMVSSLNRNEHLQSHVKSAQPSRRSSGSPVDPKTRPQSGRNQEDTVVHMLLPGSDEALNMALLWVTAKKNRTSSCDPAEDDVRRSRATCHLVPAMPPHPSTGISRLRGRPAAGAIIFQLKISTGER
jgi:hypothetical protein